MVLLEGPEFVDSIKKMICHDAGFSIDLYGILGIYQLEDGRFSVYFEDPDEPDDDGGMSYEAVFDTADSAINEFLRLRHVNKLGLDYDEPDY